MAVFSCPLCSQSRFRNLESLCFSLIKAATQNISCPICNEVLVGLDKFTIHLFGHSININDDSIDLSSLEIKEALTTSPLHNNKIMSHVDFSSNVGNPFESDKEKETETNKKIGLNCTVNMEDLCFLIPLESSSGNDDIQVLEETAPESNTVNITPNNVHSPKKDNTDLSEYMSDLLNKKLPIFDFVEGSTHETKSNRPMEVDLKNDQEFECVKDKFETQDSASFSMHREPNSSTHENKEIRSRSDHASTEISAYPNPNENIFKDFVLPRYDCHFCKKSFKMKGSLLIHYKMAHLELRSSQSLPRLSVDCQEGTEISSFRCSICHKSFKKDQYLIQHIRTHEGKQWHCEICGKYFTTKYFLKKHQRLHTGETPYSCQKCNKTFTFQQSYHKHLLYHSDEKPHKCIQCGKAFKELSTLHNHERIHSGEKPFACETCGKCFRQRVSCIVHRRIHTGILPYECTACEKKFRYKVSLRSHKCAAVVAIKSNYSTPRESLPRIFTAEISPIVDNK